jgi:serine/threonine protein kinase
VKPTQAGDPDRIGGFTVLGRLGGGGMGQVFLGTTPGGRLVAIKLVRPEYADDEQFRRRFAREVEAARKVGGFHTAQVVASDPDADPPWMALAYISGPSLADAVKSQGLLDSVRMLALGGALAEALSAIHGCGLIHRDLKPGNVILSPHGPIIVDFGLAYDESATMITVPGSVMGTPGYMSPEQHRGLRVTVATDVFSFGAVLVFAATGHGPFDVSSRGEVGERVLTGHPDLTGLSGPFRDIIARCLEKQPEDRPTVADILGRFTEQAPGQSSDQEGQYAGGERGSGQLHASTMPASHLRSTQTTGSIVGFTPDIQPLEGLPDEHSLTSMTFSKDGRYLAALMLDRMHVWETGTGRLIATPPAADSFSQMVLSADGRFLVFFTNSGDTRSVNRWKLVDRPPELPSVQLPWTSFPVISPDDRLVTFGKGNLHVLLVGTEPGSARPKFVRKALNARFRQWSAAACRVPTFSSDSSRIAVAVGGDVFVYDTATLREVVRPLRDPVRFVHGIYFAPDGRFIATMGQRSGIGKGSNVTLWDITGRQPSAWNIDDYVLAGRMEVRFSADGRVIALVDAWWGDTQKKVRFLDTSTHNLLGEIKVDEDYGFSRGGDFALSPDGRRVAAVADGKVRLLALDPSEGTLSPWEDPDGPVRQAVFTPDWRLMATYCRPENDGAFIRLWRTNAA